MKAAMDQKEIILWDFSDKLGEIFKGRQDT